MSNNNFDVYMDLGSSKIRAAVFSKDNIENNFQIEKNCFSNFNKAKFLGMYEKDLLGRGIPNTEFWLSEVFSYLHKYKIK